MAGFSNGTITLDEERDVYYPGQLLSGKLEFGLNQSLEFKAIKLVYHGEANVSWEEQEVEEYDGVRSYNNVQYGAQQLFFHVEQCVCGGVGVSQLPAGSHVIPFQYQIPFRVPSSFGDLDDEDEERSIFYYVKAVLEYHDGRESEELEEGFEIVVPIDLNDNPDMETQNVVNFEEVLSSCLCGSGPLEVEVCLPGTGFCPGTIAPVSVTADNRSSCEVTKITYELVRRVKYHSTDPPSKKTEPETVLQYSKSGAIPSKTKRTFTHKFEMPVLIPVITGPCNIIQVGYFFKVKVFLSGCNDPLEDEFEIALGQIPIRDTIDNYEHPLQSDLPRAPIPVFKPGEPMPVIQPYVYPSHTLQVINSYAGVNAVPNNYQPPAGYPYPGNANAYPGANPPYPGANPPYPGGNPPYPGANPPYPGANPPYPGGNPPYPGANPPYPGGNPPYPGANPPYPGGNPPYPGSNPANPGFTAQPGANPPYPGANANPVIGFVAPGLSPGYPPATGAPSPYNPSAPPE